MEKEHKEYIDPAFKYTDVNIRRLKDELSKELANLQDSILQTQRFLALLQIRVVHNESVLYSDALNGAKAQFISEVTSASIKVESSEQPLDIADEFKKRRWEDLKKLGVKSLRIE